MSARDADVWLAYVDAFVDGTLDEKEALRLRLAAENSPELAAAIERARGFHAALAQMPVAEPAEGFDERVLASVPLGRYASAPRRAPLVVALGEVTPDFVQHFLARLGRGLTALAVAWLGAVVVSSTTLQPRISAAASELGAALESWAVGSENPVVGPLARLMNAAYDASYGALGSVAGVVGAGATIFLVGILIGAVAFWAAARRRASLEDRAGHHA